MEAAAHLETLAKDQNTKEIAGAWQTFDNELSGVLAEVEQLLAGALRLDDRIVRGMQHIELFRSMFLPDIRYQSEGEDTSDK